MCFHMNYLICLVYDPFLLSGPVDPSADLRDKISNRPDI